MTTILKYKDYQGSADVDLDRGVVVGKILFVTDLVTYEAETPKLVQAEFEAAVDDYLETCAALGKEPQKSFTGAFNVRIDPADHRAAAVLAACDGSSLNAIVAEAVHQYVTARNGAPHQVHHVHRLVIEMPEKSFAAVQATMQAPKAWETVDGTVH